MEVFEDAPVADLDTPVAGEEIENGAEVQNEGPDETGTSYNQEMRSLIQTQ
jgi:hypothetical protein